MPSDPLYPVAKKLVHPLQKWVGIITTLVGVCVAYGFWREHIWRPKVQVIGKPDYTNGTAEVTISGKRKKIYMGSSTAAGGNWAVGFAVVQDKPVRLELKKNNITKEVLNVRNGS